MVILNVGGHESLSTRPISPDFKRTESWAVDIAGTTIKRNLFHSLHKPRITRPEISLDSHLWLELEVFQLQRVKLENRIEIPITSLSGQGIRD